MYICYTFTLLPEEEEQATSGKVTSKHRHIKHLFSQIHPPTDIPMRYRTPDYHFAHEQRQRYLELQPCIRLRLEEFSRVPKEQYFYELCYCLCTPQSKAEHAFAAVELLQKQNFYAEPFSPESILRDSKRYIRFHTTKAGRLMQAREQWSNIARMLDNQQYSDEEKREWLVANVNGFGWKEASHFLRNIGYRNLAILDRHILKHLIACRVFDTLPNIASKARYQAAGEEFKKFAAWVGIPMDELDLFFWASETGIVLK